MDFVGLRKSAHDAIPPFVDVFLIGKGGFHIAMLVYQRVKKVFWLVVNLYLFVGWIVGSLWIWGSWMVLMLKDDFWAKNLEDRQM